MSVVFVGAAVAMVATLGTLVLALTGTSPIPLPGFPEVTSNADRNPAPTGPATPPPTRPAGPAASAPAATNSAPGASPTATRKGNVPTHTPDHPRPSKTK